MGLTCAWDRRRARCLDLDPFGSSITLHMTKLDTLVGNRQYRHSDLPDFEADVLDNVSIADISMKPGAHT
jgi:hypothetical protein